MRGQELGVPGAPEGFQVTPAAQRQLDHQQKMQEAERALVPSKGEQRRLASIQLAVQAGATPETVVAVAKGIDKYISTGPNS